MQDLSIFIYYCKNSLRKERFKMATIEMKQIYEAAEKTDGLEF